MKVKSNHYEKMKKDISQVLVHNKTTVEKELKYYIDNNLGKDKEKRLRWDLLYLAGLSNFIVREVYTYAYDQHVDTALRNIIKELI